MMVLLLIKVTAVLMYCVRCGIKTLFRGVQFVYTQTPNKTPFAKSLDTKSRRTYLLIGSTDFPQSN